MELAEAIRKLYDNQELSTSLGTAGYQKLLAGFTADIHYQKLLSIYNRSVQETPDLRSDN